MIRFRKKYICICAVALLLSALAVFGAAASEEVHDPSDEYLLSKYHARIESVKITGDQRTDVVNAALSQIGYHEGNGEADMGGESNGNRNFVEYNRLHGKFDNGEGNGRSYGYHWCCSFATWCVKQAGVPDDVLIAEVSCDRLVTWLQSQSLYKKRESGYEPVSGDLIFFKTPGLLRQYASHVGIVRYAEGNRVYTVEGNKNGCVDLQDYDSADTYIVGYGVPNYVSKPDAAHDFSKKFPGVYYVTADELNIRCKPGTEYEIIGRLTNGDLVTVSEINDKGWGKISITGEPDKEAWIALSYAEYVPVARYTVRYDLNGGNYGNGVIPIQPKEEGKETFVTTAEPTREGYDFVGWAEEKTAKEARYAPGSAYNIDGDTVLYAVWAVGKVKVGFVNGDITVSEGMYTLGSVVDLPAPPVKPQDDTYVYPFAGWDGDGDGKAEIKPGDIVNARGDIVFRAVFGREFRKYVVTFKGYDDTVIDKREYHFGDKTVVPKPASIEDVYREKFKYVFSSWNKPVAETVGGDAEYVAVYEKKIAEYRIVFVGDDMKPIAEKLYHYGDEIEFPAEIPQKKADETYTYKFRGWEPERETVKRDMVYAAVFDKTFIEYKVEFVDGNGETVKTVFCRYGETPNYDGGEVTKKKDNVFEYIFDGWDRELTGITGDTRFTAVFKEVKRSYTVTFFNEDGSVIKDSEYFYGDKIEPPPDPEKKGYKFIGWTPEVTEVMGNMSFKASFGKLKTPSAPAEPGSEPNRKMSVVLAVSVISVVVICGGFAALVIIRKRK